jgi:hypothetical protein
MQKTAKLPSDLFLCWLRQPDRGELERFALPPSAKAEDRSAQFVYLQLAESFFCGVIILM